MLVCETFVKLNNNIGMLVCYIYCCKVKRNDCLVNKYGTNIIETDLYFSICNFHLLKKYQMISSTNADTSNKPRNEHKNYQHIRINYDIHLILYTHNSSF